MPPTVRGGAAGKRGGRRLRGAEDATAADIDQELGDGRRGIFDGTLASGGLQAARGPQLDAGKINLLKLGVAREAELVEVFAWPFRGGETLVERLAVVVACHFVAGVVALAREIVVVINLGGELVAEELAELLEVVVAMQVDELGAQCVVLDNLVFQIRQLDEELRLLRPFGLEEGAEEQAELGFDGIIGGRQHALEEGHVRRLMKHFKVGDAVKVAELEDMEEGAEDFAGLQGSILDAVGLQALAEDKGGGLKDGLHRFCRKWSEAIFL